MKLIDKSALVAVIKRRLKFVEERLQRNNSYTEDGNTAWKRDKALYDTYIFILSFIDTLEVKEVGVWKTIDNINLPQADKNKIYCVFTKDRYILAKVIEHPQDDDLLQWRCTEFPFHRYDMCEGDKYMQIV